MPSNTSWCRAFARAVLSASRTLKLGSVPGHQLRSPLSDEEERESDEKQSNCPLSGNPVCQGPPSSEARSMPVQSSLGPHSGNAFGSGPGDNFRFRFESHASSSPDPQSRFRRFPLTLLHSLVVTPPCSPPPSSRLPSRPDRLLVSTQDRSHHAWRPFFFRCLAPPCFSRTPNSVPCILLWPSHVNAVKPRHNENRNNEFRDMTN